MSTQEQNLLRFLNHGILPFTGRNQVIESALSFWKSLGDVDELQVLTIIGEAGIGKSRLIEELITTVPLHISNHAVLRIRLYPESSLRLIPLFTEALWRFGIAHPTFRLELDDSLESLLAALRRLITVRQTLIVMEDIHLLNGEALGDFYSLLAGVHDEPLGILCTTRPMEAPAGTTLGRYNLQEVRMEGIHEHSLGTLWQSLFGHPLALPFLQALHKTTAGNPLAIRSVLRSGVRSGLIVVDKATGIWEPVVSLPQWRHVLEHKVNRLAEGMMVHLEPKEREAAERLSVLGEVFAREAAQRLQLEPSLLECLMFKGIIVEQVGVMRSISANESSSPLLAFAHTLLHRYLLQSAPSVPDQLWHVVSNELPLYSILPLLKIGDVNRNSICLSSNDTLRTIQILCNLLIRLDEGADWSLGVQVWKTTYALAQQFLPLWSDNDRRITLCTLLHRKISLFYRRGGGDIQEYRQDVQQMIDITATNVPSHLAHCRLLALRSLFWLNYRTQSPNDAVQKEIEELIQRHPTVRHTFAYALYLHNLAHASRVINNTAMLRSVEQEVNALLEDPTAPQEIQQYAWRRVCPQLVLLFTSNQEIAKRLQQLNALMAQSRYPESELLLLKLNLLSVDGQFLEVLQMSGQALHRFRANGLERNELYGQLIQLVARSAFGLDIAAIQTQGTELYRRSNREFGFARLHAAHYLISIGLLRSASGWLSDAMAMIAADQVVINSVLRLGVALLTKQTEMLPTLIKEEHQSMGLVGELAVMIWGNQPTTMIIQAMRRWNSLEIVGVNDVLERQSAIELLRHATAVELIEQSIPLHEATSQMLQQILEWMQARKHWSFIIAFVERYNNLLVRRQQLQTLTIAGEYATETSVLSPETPRIVSHIEVFGGMRVSQPKQEGMIRLRGERVRTLLGILVADCIGNTPLQLREFHSILAKDLNDYDDIRKTLNLVVYRLREVIGYESIDTSMEVPQLRLTHVSVDIVQAYQDLDSVMQALRQGKHWKARRSLEEVLQLWQGRPPFGTLYHDFFEVLRDDFESRVRYTIVSVIQALTPNDIEGAAEVVQKAVAVMVGDSELLTIQATLLERLERRTEAQRVRALLSIED